MHLNNQWTETHASVDSLLLTFISSCLIKGNSIHIIFIYKLQFMRFHLFIRKVLTLVKFLLIFYKFLSGGESLKGTVQACILCILS
jgi:hypothetical protein